MLRGKRYLIKFLIIFLKGSLKIKSALVFLLRFLKKPLSPFGRILYWFAFLSYKGYFFAKRIIIKFIPAKDILSLATNKYIVHAAIIIVTLATVTQNIHAHTSALGEYGKKSILFKLTKPT